MEGRYKKGQQLVLHGKVDFDPQRPVRLEMINPQVESLGPEPGDSTEVGRIVPIYEAMGAISSRMLRRIVHQALGALPPDFPDRIPVGDFEASRISEPPRSFDVRAFSSAGRKY